MKGAPRFQKRPPGVYPLLLVLAHVSAWLRYFFSRKEKRWLQANLREIFGLAPSSGFARTFERQVYRHQALAALETLLEVWRPASLHWEGLAELETAVREAEAAGLGQLVITAHLGSWELVGMLAARCAQKPFYALAKPANFSWLTRFLDALRQRMQMQVLWTGHKGLVRQMLSVLAEGSWLGFVMDQKPLGRSGPQVTFFQRPTAFVSGPAQMAIRGQRPVLAVFCLRLGPLRYRVWVETLFTAGHGCSDEVAVTQKMAEVVERVIRLYPEQWCWNYKRWRFSC